jgi:hypothetical protein
MAQDAHVTSSGAQIVIGTSSANLPSSSNIKAATVVTGCRFAR